jgi:hypothetical protein
MKIRNLIRRSPACVKIHECLQQLSATLADALIELRALNAQYAIDTCQGQFREKLAQIQAKPTRLRDTTDQAAYRAGCKVLEHQFGLTRPSKSPRELLTGEPGLVLRDLKPIWMMSPLSVADTLPFAEDLFDAVIFDEASQIPLEDAVPSLYRAQQTIIVGDEMQLPPTNFFSSNKDGDEPLPDYLAYAVSADSLLTKAATTLSATQLSWHYRSRHESLISFCNRAFYNGDLNTIPGRRPMQASRDITIDKLPLTKHRQSRLAAPLLDRAISSHHISGGTYRNQQNLAEAEYAAELVRAFLRKKTGQSIGVVAFSQPQASAIESAVERLALTDKPFARELEEERERTIEGQFSRLFVKNLENVQGDERDVIIISVGYAPSSDGKMRMNFGPINQAGGEKRLNVIFSRAKQHVAVVTSIDHSQITNDYNIGANTLKQYLRYASAASCGNENQLRACLNALGQVASDGGDNASTSDAVTDHIAQSLCQNGWEVSQNVGYSTLRIDIAARKPDEAEFSKAVLVDTDAAYAIDDVVERYVTRPELFKAFGWEVEQVLAKDLITSADP